MIALRQLAAVVALASTPAPAEPRTCDAALAPVRAAAQAGDKAKAVAALRALAEEVKAAREHRPPSPCEPQLEEQLRDVARAWFVEDRHHRNYPQVRELLELHHGLFPKAPMAARVAYRLGSVLAELNACGCHW